MGHAKDKTSILVIAALGVVFGDIGTSPLYTLKVCFIGHSAITPSPQNVLGLVSLIFWSLLLVVSVKYGAFILRAHDDGEGGVFAMMAILHKNRGVKLGRGLIMAGLFGSALLYGDGLLTPVISVLSALEGLEVATTSAKPVVVPLTCCILFLLFRVQSHGAGQDRQILRSYDDTLVRCHRAAWARSHRQEARHTQCRQPGPRSQVLLDQRVGRGSLCWGWWCSALRGARPSMRTWGTSGPRRFASPGIS